MSNYLTNKFHILISSSITPTQAEINAQFAPQSMSPQIGSLASDDSGRSDDGVMRIYWVLDRVHSWDVTLPPCDTAYAANILDKVVGREYWVTMWDVATDTEITRHVYTSNSSSDVYSGIIRRGLLQDVSFKMIELGGEKNGVVING